MSARAFHEPVDDFNVDHYTFAQAHDHDPFSDPIFDHYRFDPLEDQQIDGFADGFDDGWSLEPGLDDLYEVPSSPPPYPRIERTPPRRTGPALYERGNTAIPDRNHRSQRSTPTPRGQRRNTRLDTAEVVRPSQVNSFGYIPDHFFQSPPPAHRPSPSPAERDLLHRSPIIHDRRPSHTGAIQRNINLASDISMPTASSSRPRKRSVADTGHGEHGPPKRVRQSFEDVDEVDLTAEEGGAEALLEKEREELVKTQRQAEDRDKPKTLGQMNCIICLDNFTNLSATACGHIFCHECLTQALLAGEKAADRNAGTCPMCRKPLKRAVKGHIIPLALMTKKKWTSSQKR